MSKVISINGMSVKVVDNSEKKTALSQEDNEMDIRIKEAVKAAINKAKVCRKPIARFDVKSNETYIEYEEGNRKYVR